jgi:hypothetical protein
MRANARRVLVIALLLAPVHAGAQHQGAWIRPEVRLSAGAFLPRGSVGRYAGATVALESAVELTDFADGVMSVGWAGEHATIAASASQGASIWQYHAGIEFNSTQPHDNGWIWRPVAGAGAGARTYDYDQPGIASATYPSSYGSLGVDVQGGAVAYRLEVRGYLSPFKPPLSGARQIRHDLAITAGIAHHF